MNLNVKPEINYYGGLYNTESDDDGDGVANAKDECADTPKGGNVGANGCLQGVLGPQVTEMKYLGYDELTKRAKIRVTFDKALGVTPGEWGFIYSKAYKVVVKGNEVSAVNVAFEQDQPFDIHVVEFLGLEKGQSYQFLVKGSAIQDEENHVMPGVYKKMITIQ